MREFLKKHRVHLLGGAGLFAALIFYSLNLRHRDATGPFERTVLTVISPVTGVITAVNNAVRSAWEGYLSLVDIKEENRRLLHTIKIQNERLIRGNEAFYENERLNRLLMMKEDLPGRTVAARVIGEDITPWSRTIIINQGERNGVREGMPAVATSGVVGQVVKVGRGSAKVLLLTDHASAMSAVIQRTRARGVVRGQGGDLCSLEFANRADDIKVGDIVVTSGIGGIFPRGIPIGEVTMVRKGEYGIFQTVSIRPSVNLGRMEELLVITDRAK